MDSNFNETGQVSPHILNQTIHPQQQSAGHQWHHSQYRCYHGDQNFIKPRNTSEFKPQSITDNSYILLADQRTRNLTDVYRRDKDFFNKKPMKNNGAFDERLNNTKNNEYEAVYVIKDNYNSIPCNCETSFLRKTFQNCIDGMKMGIEFFLFIGYVIRNRDQLLECQYPFTPHAEYNAKMTKLNKIRYQLNRKTSPMKYKTTCTYYDVH